MLFAGFERENALKKSSWYLSGTNGHMYGFSGTNASLGHIPYIFPIRWGAKELLRVSEPSNRLVIINPY